MYRHLFLPLTLKGSMHFLGLGRYNKKTKISGNNTHTAK